MLVQFTLKNVLSFKEETTLDMTAVNAYKEHECNLIQNGTKEKFLKVAAVYGANASGKSNLCLAMIFFQGIIAESLNNVGNGEETAIKKYFKPFSFEDNGENSEFQIVETIDGFEYCYGFEYNADCIVQEWLYRKNLKTNRMVTIFERTKENIGFGASIKKECDVYKEQIPVETLALSFFNKLKLKTDIFRNVYSGIMDISLVPADFSGDDKLFEKVLPEMIDDSKENLMEFLTAIDSGIMDITYEESEKQIVFYTFHKGKDGKGYSMDFFSESEGTIKSILVLIYARSVISRNACMFVDGLDTKLHPLLLKFIIDLFYGQDSSAQLIYTTHDTMLMDKKFFRRDQIWFVKKDEYGYSGLSALSDFKVRSDASFGKDYLAGVYGGVPRLKEFQMKESIL